jgi:hypothetical protein
MIAKYVEKFFDLKLGTVAYSVHMGLYLAHLCNEAIARNKKSALP